MDLISDEERKTYIDVLGSGSLLYKLLKETNGSQGGILIISFRSYCLYITSSCIY